MTGSPRSQRFDCDLYVPRRKEHRYTALGGTLGVHHHEPPESGIRILGCFLTGGRQPEGGSRRRQNSCVQKLTVLGQGGFALVKGDLSVGQELPAEPALFAVRAPSDIILNDCAIIVNQSGSAQQRI